jgi:hypothetical protein
MTLTVENESAADGLLHSRVFPGLRLHVASLLGATPPKCWRNFNTKRLKSVSEVRTAPFRLQTFTQNRARWVPAPLSRANIQQI